MAIVHDDDLTSDGTRRPTGGRRGRQSKSVAIVDSDSSTDRGVVTPTNASPVS